MPGTSVEAPKGFVEQRHEYHCSTIRRALLCVPSSGDRFASRHSHFIIQPQAKSEHSAVALCTFWVFFLLRYPLTGDLRLFSSVVSSQKAQNGEWRCLCDKWPCRYHGRIVYGTRTIGMVKVTSVWGWHLWKTEDLRNGKARLGLLNRYHIYGTLICVLLITAVLCLFVTSFLPVLPTLASVIGCVSYPLSNVSLAFVPVHSWEPGMAISIKLLWVTRTIPVII